jgi:energy-coupling factor transporter transmembrane protein EcfT
VWILGAAIVLASVGGAISGDGVILWVLALIIRISMFVINMLFGRSWASFFKSAIILFAIFVVFYIMSPEPEVKDEEDRPMMLLIKKEIGKAAAQGVSQRMSVSVNLMIRQKISQCQR